MTERINHELVSDYSFQQVRCERRPVKDRAGKVIDGPHQIWIMLDNERQLNSCTTAAVKEVILAFRRASADRRATIDLRQLDEAVDRFATKLLYTFPDCTRKTLESPLTQVEQQYVNEVLANHDGNEGIVAFLEHRNPVWEDS